MPEILDVKKITVHYVDTAIICIESVIKVNSMVNLDTAKSLAASIREKLAKEHDIHNADIYLDLA
jgi:divalent metal cation (Fe/Co/Zn/Cd) transporter